MALETPSDDTPPMNSHQQNDDPSCGSGKEERERDKIEDVNMEDGEILEDGEIVDSGDDEMPSDAHHMFRGSQNPWAGMIEQMNNEPIEEVSRKKKKKKKRKRKKKEKSDSEEDKGDTSFHLSSPEKAFTEHSSPQAGSGQAEKKPRRHRKHRTKRVQNWLYADSDHSQQSEQEYMSEDDEHGYREMQYKEDEHGYEQDDIDMDGIMQNSPPHASFGRGREMEFWGGRGRGRDMGRGRGGIDRGKGADRGRGSDKGRGPDKGRGSDRGRGSERGRGGADRGRGGGDRGRGSQRGKGQGVSRSQQSKPPPEITKNLICKFYLDDACLKGANCTYSHDLNPPKKPEICKFYLQDSCARGETCLFYHGQYPCKFFHMGQPCFQGDNCKFSHGTLTDKTRPLLDKVLNSNKEFPPQGTKPGLLGDSPYDNPVNPVIPSLFDIKVAPTEDFLKRKPVEFYGSEEAQESIEHHEHFQKQEDSSTLKQHSQVEQVQQDPRQVQQHEGSHNQTNVNNQMNNQHQHPKDQVLHQQSNNQQIDETASNPIPPNRVDNPSNETEIKKPHSTAAMPPMPAKQRELFLRIQQKQQSDSATEDETPKAQKTDDADNWYSSDEEDESKKNLSMILKTIRTNTSSSTSAAQNSPSDRSLMKPAGQLPNAIVSLLEMTGLVPSSASSSNPAVSENNALPKNSLTVDINVANSMPSGPSSPCDFRLVDITHSQDVKDPRIGRDRKNMRNITFKVCKWMASEHTVSEPPTPIELTTPTELKSRVGFPQVPHQPVVKPSDPRLQKVKDVGNAVQVQGTNLNPQISQMKSPPQDPRVRPSMPAALLRPPADFGIGSPPPASQIRPQRFSGPGSQLGGPPNKNEGMWLASGQDPAAGRPPPAFRDPRLKSDAGNSPPSTFSPPRQPYFPLLRPQNRMPTNMGPPPPRGVAPRGLPQRMPFPGPTPRPRFQSGAAVRHEMGPGSWRSAGPAITGQTNTPGNDIPKSALNDPRLSRRNNPAIVDQRVHSTGPQDPRIAEPRGPVTQSDPRVHSLPPSDPRQRAFDPRLSRQNMKAQVNTDLSDPRKRPMKDDNSETAGGFSIPKIARMEASSDADSSSSCNIMEHRPVPNAHHNMPQILGSFTSSHQTRMSQVSTPSSQSDSGTWLGPNVTHPEQGIPAMSVPQPPAPLKDVFKTKDPTASPFC